MLRHKGPLLFFKLDINIAILYSMVIVMIIVICILIFKVRKQRNKLCKPELAENLSMSSKEENIYVCIMFILRNIFNFV